LQAGIDGRRYGLREENIDHHLPLWSEKRETRVDAT